MSESTEDKIERVIAETKKAMEERRYLDRSYVLHSIHASHRILLNSVQRTYAQFRDHFYATTDVQIADYLRTVDGITLYSNALKEERQMSENVKAAMTTYGATLDELIELRKKTEAQYDALPVYDKEPIVIEDGGVLLPCPACKARARHDFRYFNRFSGSQPQEVGIEKPSLRTRCLCCGYEVNFRVVLDKAEPDEIPVEAHVRRKRRTKAEIEEEKTAAAPQEPSVPVPGDPDFIGPVMEPLYIRNLASVYNENPI